MKIQLKPETEELIQSYNADDVIIKALKVLSEWKKEDQEWKEHAKKSL
jgi:antitoxin ParD1/3/4